MDLKVKIASSVLIILFLASTVKAQCTLNSAELQTHMLNGNVFLKDVTAIMREVAGIHRLVVQWELAHPACMDSVCVLFPSGGIGQHCVSSTQSTEASIPDLPCNRNVEIRVDVSGGNLLRSSSTLTIYIGGNPQFPPSTSPHSVFARQIRIDPHRIEMGWEPMTCLQQNSPITNYLVEYGRTNTTELRTVITEGTYIFSLTFNANKGLGLLHFGEEYWFKVAARNTNGQGPFSVTLRATPLALPSDPPPPPPTTTPPPSTAPPTTPSTPPPITTSQSPPPPVTTITTLSVTTTKAPVTTAEIEPKLTTTMQHTQKPSTPIIITDQPTQGSSSRSTPKSTTEKDKTIMLPDDSASKGEDNPTTLPNSNREDHSKPPTKPTDIANLNPSTGGSKTVIIVSALLAVIVLIVTATTALVVWMLWRHRAIWKKQGRVSSLNALNNTFPVINRDSQLLSSTPQSLEKIYDEIKPTEPRLKEYMKSITVWEGQEVNLRISFSGIPRPTVTWFFNGKRMQVESQDGREHCNNGSIFIASAEAKHAGIYDFIVSNSVGSVEGCTNLKVLVKEKQPVEEKKRSVVSSNPIRKDKFGEHVSAYHALNNSGFIEEYQLLPSGEEDRRTIVGRTSGNRSRNRFRNILCYDDNRVMLEPIPGYMNCHHDYINASYVDGYLQPKRYVAVQAPMHGTLTDFWRLVWQEKVQNIAMLTNLMEGRQRKCEQYWPESGSEEYGPFMVTLIEEQVFADYTIRTMHLVASKPGGGPNLRKVTQFHFTTWPDHGVPEYAGPLLQYLRRIKTLHKPKKGPLLVHCSAGVGRTGTLISIDTALAQAAREGIVNIPAIVTKMRTERMKMVQSPDQYAFIHDAVLEWLICGDTKIPAGEMKRAMERLFQKEIQTGQNGYETQFKVLEQISPNQKHIERATALRCPNKNRNSNYLPPDKWRVILRAQTIETTYINASFVNAYKQRRGIIVAQAPMRNTTEDFWKMLYERECAVVVMLSDLKEKGKEICFQYWPMVKANTRIDGVKHGSFSVFTLESKRQDGYMMRTFGVTDHKNEHMRRITQFHMTSWTDEGLYENPKAIMKIIDEVFLIQRRTGNKPIVVHGLDTISRCGVFCALLNCIECCKTESIVDIFQAVKALRIQKPGMIQTVEQYQFIHDLMLLFLNSFSQYSNFK